MSTSGVNGAAAQRRGGLLARVQRGVVADRPLRLFIYGVEGVGKSTFAAGAREPIFLDCEQGTLGLAVERAAIGSWRELRDAVRDLTHEQHGYRTAVVDTADAADRLCQAHVCAANNWGGIEDPGYGKGWTAVVEEWARLLADLEVLQAKRAMNVVLLGHASVESFSDPAGAEWKRWAPRLPRKVADVLKGWVEGLLFATRKVQSDRRDKGRGRGGERVLVTEWSPGADAKNRRQLPAVLPLDWRALVDALRRGAALTRAPEPEPEPEALDDLMGDEVVPDAPPTPNAPTAPDAPAEPEPAAEAPDEAAVECDGLEADALHMLSQIPGDAMQDDARAKWAVAIRTASEKRDVARLKAGKARLEQMVAAQAKEAS